MRLFRSKGIFEAAKKMLIEAATEGAPMTRSKSTDRPIYTLGEFTHDYGTVTTAIERLTEGLRRILESYDPKIPKPGENDARELFKLLWKNMKWWMGVSESSTELVVQMLDKAMQKYPHDSIEFPQRKGWMTVKNELNGFIRIYETIGNQLGAEDKDDNAPDIADWRHLYYNENYHENK